MGGRTGAVMVRAIHSIRTWAVTLLLIVAAAPALSSMLLLMRVSRDAVRTAEKQLQASILAEAAGVTVRTIRDVQSDAQAVANAMGEASQPGRTPEQTMAAVKATLATRASITAARFEVPAARIDTMLRKTGETGDAPSSTVTLRKRADEHGVAFAVTGPQSATLVVPVLAAADASEKGASGYITVGLDLARLETRLADIVDARFPEQGANIAVIDGDRRVVAGHGGAAAPQAGQDASSLAVLARLPAGISWDHRIAIVAEHEHNGVMMVGAVETVAELGWAVAIWRPEPVAYASLDKLRRNMIVVSLAGVLLAVLVGLIASRSVTRPILQLVHQARLIGQRDWRAVQLPNLGRSELGVLSQSLAQMAGDLEQGERKIADEARLRGDLSRYLSKEIVSAIVEGKQNLALGGERRMVTVLFADVVAFTPLTEVRPAEQVVALLNELFSLMTEIVFRHGGIIDKFIGDCMMAVWGAPVAAQDHAARALAAAEDIMRFLDSANELWRKQYGIEVRLAIGVNSGEAVVGNIGSDKRMEYTVIGDVVNVAARLESVAAPNQVLVGAQTQAIGGEGFPLRDLGERKITGRDRAIAVFELETQA